MLLLRHLLLLLFSYFFYFAFIVLPRLKKILSFDTAAPYCSPLCLPLPIFFVTYPSPAPPPHSVAHPLLYFVLFCFSSQSDSPTDGLLQYSPPLHSKAAPQKEVRGGVKGNTPIKADGWKKECLSEAERGGGVGTGGRQQNSQKKDKEAKESNKRQNRSPSVGLLCLSACLSGGGNSQMMTLEEDVYWGGFFS